MAPKPSMSSEGSKRRPRLAKLKPAGTRRPQCRPAGEAESWHARRGAAAARSTTVSATPGRSPPPPSSARSRHRGVARVAWICSWSRRWRRRPETAGARAASICSRRPAATTTPSDADQRTPKAQQGQASVRPVSIVRAGIGATSPLRRNGGGAEDAAVWLMLFSRRSRRGCLSSGSMNRHRSRSRSARRRSTC